MYTKQNKHTHEMEESPHPVKGQTVHTTTKIEGFRQAGLTQKGFSLTVHLPSVTRKLVLQPPTQLPGLMPFLAQLVQGHATI